MKNIRNLLIYGERKNIYFLYEKYKDKSLFIRKSLDKIFIDIYEGKDYKSILEYVKLNNLEIAYEFIVREFSQTEFDSLPYYRLLIDWNSDRNLYIGVYCNPYKYDHCEFCCTGKHQLEPLSINIREMQKFDIFPVTPELIVSEGVKRELEKANTTGCWFHEVFDINKRKPDTKFYQICVASTLPPVREYTETTLRMKHRCQWCGYQSKDVSGTAGYDKSAFEEKLDFYVMAENQYEELYWSNDIRFRNQQFIISNKVKRIFEKYSNRFFDFSAVYIDE